MNIDDSGSGTNAGSKKARFDFEITLPAFNEMVGLGWQLGDDAPVMLCVGESISLRKNDAHCEPVTKWPGSSPKARYHPVQLLYGRENYQYLVVRAGAWECYPEVHFLRRCCNYPGVCFQLGDLRS